MKKTRTALLGFAIAASSLLSFQKHGPALLKGKITPAFYAINAWAISKHDTLYTSVEDGSFAFPINEPGTYKIIIEARSPYRSFEKDGVVVKEGEQTDLGPLSLKKWD
ncbi:MAG: carboxypeptidase-like regulatory domain-containing protein [Flavisolibacter sp.]